MPLRDEYNSPGLLTAAVAKGFRWWRTVLADPNRGGCTPGDNNCTTSSFSAAPIAELLRARVPIFVGYGTRDKAVLSDDYLRLESIRLHKTHFTFREYLGREHNFFCVKPDGTPCLVRLGLYIIHMMYDRN